MGYLISLEAKLKENEVQIENKFNEIKALNEKIFKLEEEISAQSKLHNINTQQENLIADLKNSNSKLQKVN